MQKYLRQIDLNGYVYPNWGSSGISSTRELIKTSPLSDCRRTVERGRQPAAGI